MDTDTDLPDTAHVEPLKSDSHYDAGDLFQRLIQGRPEQRERPPLKPKEFIGRLRDHLYWCPPPIAVVSPRESLDSFASLPSLSDKKTVRREQFYQRHLDESLVVKRVVLIKDLLGCIASVVLEYAKKLIDNDQIPKIAPITRTPAAIKMLDFDLELKNIFSEQGVSDRYFLGASRLSSPIASALVLHPTNWERSLITWATDVRWKKWDIKDGSLQFPLELQRSQLKPSSQYISIRDSMNSELKRLLPTMATLFNPLAIWDFKSLTMGDDTVMEEIIDIGKGKSHFRWQFCSEFNGKPPDLAHESSTAERPSDAKHTNLETDGELLLGAKGLNANRDKKRKAESDLHEEISEVQYTGVDQDTNAAKRQKTRSATTEDSQIHQTSKNEASSPKGSDKKDPCPKHSRRLPKVRYVAIRGIGSDARSPPWKSLLPPYNVPINVEEDTTQTAQPLNIEQREVDGRGSEGDNTGDSGTAVNENDSMETGSPTKRGRKEILAQAFIQQAWAEAVRTRCSIVVINSGNNEIIGIRHRESQTLYITDLINPHKPKNDLGYGQIQIGLHICAILDVVDRARQYEEELARQKASAVPEARASHQLSRESEHEKKDSSEPFPPKGKDSEIKVKISSSVSDGMREICTKGCLQMLLKTATTRNFLFLYLRYGHYNSPVPAPFVRHGCASTAPQDESIHMPSTAKFMNIILTSEKTPQSTGIVHIGVIEAPNCDGNIRVAAKLGFSCHEKEVLEGEYALYCHLNREGVKGIPQCIGLFVDSDLYEDETTALEGPSALVMTYAGRSLYHRAHNLPKSAKLSLISTLNSIHASGILHGDIRDANLCRLNDKEVFIIDFSHASTGPSAKKKRMELAQLCELLQIDLKEAHAMLQESQVSE